MYEFLHGCGGDLASGPVGAVVQVQAGADLLAEQRVAHQVAQFDPGPQLVQGGVVGQAGA